MVTEEAAAAALEAALKGAAAFGKVTRRDMAPSQMATVGSPGLALVGRFEETRRPSPSVPGVRTLTIVAYVYVEVDARDPNATPASALNPILTAIHGALAPDNVVTGLCTLGGTVYACLIRGKPVIFAPGDKTGFGVAVVPIDVILP